MKLFIVAALGAALSLSNASNALETRSGVAERQIRDLMVMLPGTYTNAETVYFDGLIEDQVDKASPLSVAIDKSEDGAITLDWDGEEAPLSGILTLKAASDGSIDGSIIGDDGSCSFNAVRGVKEFAVTGDCGLSAIAESGLTYTDNDRDILLSKAREFTCWMSMPKKGGEGWAFHPGLKMHDQGGTIWIEDENAETPKIGFRMRRVNWPYGRNAPSLVLYVHTTDAQRAESYSWADYDGTRVGINLRWVQGSCSIPK